MRRTLGTLLIAAAAAAAADTPTIRIGAEPLHTVDRCLFGQFLEFGGKSEPGFEDALDAKGKLRADVLERMRALAIPMIRFPGGGEVEFGEHWTERVDNAPGREGQQRGAGRRFGYHDFMDLCEQLGAEPMIVVAIARSTMPWKNTSEEQSVADAAAIVAYMNGRADDPKLPKELRRWAELRVKNGRPEPYGIKLWQAGNEPFIAVAGTLEKHHGKSREEIAAEYVRLLEAHIAAMRSADASIAILVEWQMEDNKIPIPVLKPMIEKLRGKVQFLTHHVYQPWGIEDVQRDGKPATADSVSNEEYWRAIASAPGTDPSTGFSLHRPKSWDAAVAAGLPFAVTEWNLNTWWAIPGRKSRPPLPESMLANGIGAAGFLHAWMRDGAHIRMAAQSMLVGSKWGIGAIKVDPARPDWTMVRPSGLVTGLYAKYHGEEFLPVTAEGIPSYRQPLKLGNIAAMEKVALVDPVATRSANTLFVGLIHRDFDSARLVRIEWDQKLGTATRATVRAMVGRLADEPREGEPDNPAAIQERPVEPAAIEKHALAVELAPFSVSVVEIALNGPAAP